MFNIFYCKRNVFILCFLAFLCLLPQSSLAKQALYPERVAYHRYFKRFSSGINTHMFSSYTLDGLFVLKTNPGTNLTPDNIHNIIDDVYLKVYFAENITPAIYRVNTIRSCNKSGANHTFDNPSNNFHYSTTQDNALVLVNNYVAGEYEALDLPDQWEIVFNCSESDIKNVELNVTYHTTVSSQDLSDLNAADGYLNFSNFFTGQSTLATVDLGTLEKEHACQPIVNGQPIPYDKKSENLIVLVHGWNPAKYKNKYGPGKLDDACADGRDGLKDDGEKLEFSWYHLYKNLLSNDLIKNDWTVARYDWSEDASTGPASIIGGVANANQARDRAHIHGLRLGKLLADHSPKKVQFIAHSAGNWAARRAADYLRHQFGVAIKLEIIALDPFVQNGPVAEDYVSAFDLTRQWVDRAENYYVQDLGTDLIDATSVDFPAWDINCMLEISGSALFDYTWMMNHSGPVMWYAKTVEYSEQLPPEGFAQSIAYADVQYERPEVTGVYSSDSIVGHIETNEQINICFSDNMDVSSLESGAVQLTGSESGEHYFFSAYNEPSFCFGIKPKVDFTPGETVTVTVTTSAKNRNGAVLATPETRTFTAVELVPEPPASELLHSDVYVTGLESDQNIVLSFNKNAEYLNELARSAESGESVWVRFYIDNTTGNDASGKVSAPYDPDTGQIVFLVPEAYTSLLNEDSKVYIYELTIPCETASYGVVNYQTLSSSWIVAAIEQDSGITLPEPTEECPDGATEIACLVGIHQVGSYDTPGSVRRVVMSGNYAYVADGDSGLQIINISTPNNPSLAGFRHTNSYTRDVAVSGNYAYVADRDSGLQIINISNPNNPSPAGAYDTPGSARGVAVSGNYAYVAEGDSGLQIIDCQKVIENQTLIDTYYASLAAMMPSRHLVSELPGDDAFTPDEFTKEWQFNEDISSLTVSIISNTYAGTASLTADGDTLSITLTPDSFQVTNRIELQFTDSDGTIVQVDGSNIFWAETRTNHAPRLADGQLTQVVSPTDTPAQLFINTFDGDGDTVSLGVSNADGGYVIFYPDNPSTLYASFSDSEPNHTVTITLNDGKESVEQQINVFRYDTGNIDSFYTDADSNGQTYDFDAIAFATLQGVVAGQVDPDDTTSRIFRPDDDASMAEALAMIIGAAKQAGLIELVSRLDYADAYPSWVEPYYSYALDQGAVDDLDGNLSILYPTREEIARLIVKVLGLDQKLAAFSDLAISFSDADDFGNLGLARYGQMCNIFGLFMTGDYAYPQTTVPRSHLAEVIEKIFMIPCGEVTVFPAEIDHQDSFTVGIQNIFAQRVSATDYTLMDSSGEVDSAMAVNLTQVSPGSIDSSFLRIGTNQIIAFLDNDGVTNVITSEIQVNLPDRDGDGYRDELDAFPDDETEWFDADSDGIGDNGDNCSSMDNPDQTDSNDNGIGDACDNDSDSDGDGLSDAEEYALGTNPLFADSDNSGDTDFAEAMVVAGYQYTVGLKLDGTVVAVGSNDHGQCNLEDWNLGTSSGDEPDPQEAIIILTDASPNANVEADRIAKIYGTNGVNNINVESGAEVELINFPGANRIAIQAQSLFTAYRTGAMVILDGSDGTKIKLSATMTPQSITFNDVEKILVIDSGRVMINDQIVNLDSATVTINQEATSSNTCGAYIAPGVWKEFDCYNLAAIGKTTGNDPFTPSWRLIGGYWQWGRKGPDESEWYDTNTSNFAHGPTGPDEADANDDSISEWADSHAPDGAWSDDEKTSNDPCPSGYRVPTKAQWQGVIDNNTQSIVGTWSDDATNYSSGRFFGDDLMLPAAGIRSFSGWLTGRGGSGNYWSSTEDSGGSDFALHLFFFNSNAVTYSFYRRGGYSVRCVEEDATQSDSVWYKDSDGDGYSDGESRNAYTRPGDDYYLSTELTATEGDYDDNDYDVHPGAEEICDNGIDDDCDGGIDEGCTAYSSECGAYIAPGVWKEFDCYNLAAIGKTTGDDPFTPSWRLIGGYWQWGRKGPDSSQWYDTNTSNFAHGPTGPDAADANDDSISGWDDSYAPDGAWSDSEKTPNDPCPDGYRVPTQSQWEGVYNNNTQYTVGTWIWSAADDTNYSSAIFLGDDLMLPAAGIRNIDCGSSLYRGYDYHYWSSTDIPWGRGSGDSAWKLNGSTGRGHGLSVRCVSE